MAKKKPIDVEKAKKREQRRVERVRKQQEMKAALKEEPVVQVVEEVVERKTVINEHVRQLKTCDVVVEIPTMDTDHYKLHRINAHLDSVQRRSLRRIYDGLQYSGALMKNGKVVRTQQDALRWVLEQVDESLSAA